jgi:integrase
MSMGASASSHDGRPLPNDSPRLHRPKHRGTSTRRDHGQGSDKSLRQPREVGGTRRTAARTEDDPARPQRHSSSVRVRRRREARHWNPATAAKPPKLRLPDATKDVWTAEQVQRFLASVADDRLGSLWLLAASSGLRRGELLGASWHDLDLEAATLTVRSTRVAYGSLVVTKEPKTARSRRTIPLSPRTVDALRTWKARQGRERLAAGAAYADLGLVFSDELGGYLSPSAISKTFGRLVKTAGLPRITLHQVRHSFATIALEQGVDVLYVSELLGHSNPAITQTVYQHARPERVRKAVDTISRAIGT